MINHRNFYLQKIIFILSILFLLSSCDIIDEMFGGGSDDSNNNQQNNGKTILRVEVHFFIDDCTIVWTYPPPQNPITAAHTSHGASFTSVAGTSTYQNDIYETTFSGTSLGVAYTGTMEIMFFDSGNLPSVSVDIDQTRQWGGTTKYITLYHPGVLLDNSISTDTVDEYVITDTHFTTTYIDASDDGSQTKTLQSGYVCGPNSYLKVQVYYQ